MLQCLYLLCTGFNSPTGSFLSQAQLNINQLNKFLFLNMPNLTLGQLRQPKVTDDSGCNKFVGVVLDWVGQQVPIHLWKRWLESRRGQNATSADCLVVVCHRSEDCQMCPIAVFVFTKQYQKYQQILLLAKYSQVLPIITCFCKNKIRLVCTQCKALPIDTSLLIHCNYIGFGNVKN